ncbi:MAG: TRIC cation channel family protein [Patescibacteria group bacterium]|jgi:uncharacterized membrane protein YeiH
MLIGQFELPLYFEVIAVFLLAITGAMVASEKKYDFSGVFVLAFITGASGAIIRDGVFLSQMPVIIEDWQYLASILVATIITPIFIYYIKKINLVFIIIDALGLGLFAIISTQMALKNDLNILAAVLIGMVGAVSGGFLRDIFTKSEPLLLKPGQYYITASLVGIILFAILTSYISVNAQISAILSIALIFLIRMLSYAFNWRTFPAINLSQKIFKKNK